jgi:hypothetical protein
MLVEVFIKKQMEDVKGWPGSLPLMLPAQISKRERVRQKMIVKQVLPRELRLNTVAFPLSQQELCEPG